MINVVQEIVDKLRTVYPSAQYDIYTERIEQGFSLRRASPFGSFVRTSRRTRPACMRSCSTWTCGSSLSDGRPQEQCRETAQMLTLLLRRTGKPAR